MKPELVRFLIGLGAVLVLLVICFAVAVPAARRWGATQAEIARQMIGDDRHPNPLVVFNNSVTINAPVEQVWPWIAQMGEGRGGFYSYTFIENLVSGGKTYFNADRILPELQNPQPGDVFIAKQLEIKEVKTGEYLFAENMTEGMNWTWVWQIDPASDGQTRLHNRFKISVPPEVNSPVMKFVLEVGAFVMEQNMMQGTKLRAEGKSEPDFIEPLEIGLWLAALAAGLVAASAYVRMGSPLALGVGLVAVLWLVILTFVQPAIWLRGVGDLILIAAAYLTTRG
jgi:hypothetical protein